MSNTGMKKQYLNHIKTRGGPGGTYCPCCNKYGTHTCKMKAKSRRLVRRTEKQSLTLNHDNDG